MSQSRGKFLVLCICLMLDFDKVKGQAQGLCMMDEMLRITTVGCFRESGPDPFFCQAPAMIPGRILPLPITTVVIPNNGPAACTLAPVGQAIEAVIVLPGQFCIGTVFSCVAATTTSVTNMVAIDDDSPESAESASR